MSLKKTNDNKGSYRGAGAYSKDYASFEEFPGAATAGYPTHDFWDDVGTVGDYEHDAAFTGKVSEARKGKIYGTSKLRNPRYSDGYTNRGDGKYSPTSDGSLAAEGAGLGNDRGFQGEKGKYGGGYDEGY